MYKERLVTIIGIIIVSIYLFLFAVSLSGCNHDEGIYTQNRPKFEKNNPCNQKLIIPEGNNYNGGNIQ